MTGAPSAPLRPAALFLAGAALLCFLPDGAAAGAERPPADTFTLAAGRFRMGEAAAALPEALRARPGGGDAYALVHFDSALAPGRARRDLERDVPGALGLDILPPRTVVFRLPARTLEVARRRPGVVAVDLYHPAFKLSPDLDPPELPLGEGRAAVLRVAITLFATESLEETALRLRRLGIEVTGRVERPHRRTLYARLAERDRPRLLDIARWPSVRFIEPVPLYRALNSNTDQVVQAGAVGAGNPYWSAGLLGSGQVAAAMDSGLDVDTPWLAHTLSDAGAPGAGHRKVLSYTAWGGGTIGTCACVNISPSAGQPFSLDHGTLAVANILANRQDFGLSDIVDGMAPGARVHFQDIGNSSDRFGTCDFGALYPPDDLMLPLEDARSRGAAVHNNSWGSAQGDSYTAAASDVDEFLWAHPGSAILFAAGDCGPEGGSNCPRMGSATIGSPGSAKNDITVGAAEQDPSQQNVAGFSSRGPETTGSGRIGPTVTMVGVDTARVHPFASVNGAQDLGSDCRFASGDCDISGTPAASCILFGAQGTSYATSFTSGALLLIRDYLARGFFPSGAARPEDALAEPSGPLLKAMLINSTAFMRGAGAGADRFNADQGYGRLMLTRGLPLAGDPLTPGGLALWDLARQEGLGASEVARQHRFTVEGTAREVRVALAYYDPPSAAGSGGGLINDLSLSVTDPNGNVYRGNSFTGEFSVRNGGAEDTRNPTEMVVIRPDDLAPGTYTATVSVGAGGVHVPHPVLGGQPYALAAVGDITQVSDVPTGLGSVPGDPLNPGTPLAIALEGSRVTLAWGASCLDQDYAVYRGSLADLPAGSTALSGPIAASTGGSRAATDDAPGEAVYYIVTPHDGTHEGSYGVDSRLSERPPSARSPYTQVLGPCGP